jgi:hypothetical protein
MDKYALVIGTGKYDPAANAPDLPFAINDAQAIATLLRNQRIGKFPEFDVTLIKDGQQWLIARMLEELFANARRDDLVVVYFSCHGVKDDFGDLHLLTSSTKRQYMAATSLSIDFIKKLMERSKSHRQVLILDTCFSGAFGRDLLFKGSEILPLDVLSGEGRYVMAASSSVQQALPDEGREHSLFSRFLIEGLRTGQADADEDGLISIKELFDYVYNKVVEVSNGRQTPKSWGLDVAGDLYLAMSQKTNSLLTKFKLDPERTVKAIRDWGLNEFQVLDGIIPDNKLITRPIITQNELKICYLPPPCVTKIRDEIKAGRLKKAWLFVSPQGTGKTSLLTYLSAVTTEKGPRQKIFKVMKVPTKPDIDSFFEFVSFYLQREPSRVIAIFDGNISEPGCIDLLSQLLASQRKVTIWATCTPEEYGEASKVYPHLDTLFEVRNAPGYVDSDPNYFRSFVETKLKALSQEVKQELLRQHGVTMGYLCSMYNTQALMPETVGFSTFSQKNIAQEIQRSFYSMPRQAQFFAQTAKYFESIPYEVFQLLASQTELFSESDLELTLQRKFVFLEHGVLGLSPTIVKPTGHLHQVGGSDLLKSEKVLLINELLDMGEQQQQPLLILALLLQMLSFVSVDMSVEHQRRYRQLVRCAEGGRKCDTCGIYCAADMHWCPTCGRKVASDSEMALNETVSVLEEDLEQPIPFPMPEFAEDVGRPKFVWSELDLSAF